MEAQTAVISSIRPAASRPIGAKAIRVPARMRKMPQQERSQHMVIAIREAAILSFEESSGSAGASMQTIALRAGASLGSVYQYYANLEAVLASVYEDVITGLLKMHTRRGLCMSDLRANLIGAVAALDTLFQGNLGESVYKPILSAARSCDELSSIIRHYFKPFESGLIYAETWRRVIS